MTAPLTRRSRILIVEDERDAADSLRMLLELVGFEVDVAYTGPQGVEEALRWRPGVVLCASACPAWTATAWQSNSGATRPRPNPT
jgi:DNA-binding response OmpR family regulator